MIKFSKILIFGAITLALGIYVYIYEYKKSEERVEADQAKIVNFDIDQINYFQIIKPDMKIALQKTESGWNLLEPIDEKADLTAVQDLLVQLTSEKQIATVKVSEQAFSEVELNEYGLDKPAIIFNLKNNSGTSRKIAVGSVKNYEGQSYLQIDSGNKIILAGNTWFNRSNDSLITYRDKRLFRDSLAAVNKIKIKNLQDSFELFKTNNVWKSPDHKFDLDQAQIREILKKISDSSVEEYVSEGEPSQSLLKQKQLDNPAVTVELAAGTSSWSARMNINSENKALYLLSDRPTYLAKVTPLIWETLATITLDGLRDRVTAFAFNAEEVKKIYYKNKDKETNLIFNSGSWLMGSATNPYFEVDKSSIVRAIKKIYDLRISEFIDTNVKDEFQGQNMLILKSETEKLVLQLNWGPSFKMNKGSGEKEYYYARTHLSNSIFALEKSVIESLGLESDQIVRKNDLPPKPPNESDDKKDEQ